MSDTRDILITLEQLSHRVGAIERQLEPECAVPTDADADPGDRDPSQVSGSWIDRHGRYSGPVEDHATYDADFYRRECESLKKRLMEAAEEAQMYKARYNDCAKKLEDAHHESATLRDEISIIRNTVDKAYRAMMKRAVNG